MKTIFNFIRETIFFLSSIAVLELLLKIMIKRTTIGRTLIRTCRLSKKATKLLFVLTIGGFRYSFKAIKYSKNLCKKLTTKLQTYIDLALTK